MEEKKCALELQNYYQTYPHCKAHCMNTQKAFFPECPKYELLSYVSEEFTSIV